MFGVIKMRLYLSIAAIALCALFTGCSSIIDARKQKTPFMELYYGGKVTEAANLLAQKSEDRKDTGDELMWRLDEGTALFTAGDYKKSLTAFEQTENLIQAYDKRATISARDAGAETGSLMTNLNALPYRGLCADRIMLNAYKAFDYFALDDTSGAQVEIRRMREAQQTVAKQFQEEIDRIQKEIDAGNLKNQQQANEIGDQQDATLSFNKLLANKEIRDAYEVSGQKSNKLYGNMVNPFAAYFSAMGYLIDNNYGEAMVDFRNLYRMDAKNQLFRQDYVTCAKAIGDKIPDALKAVKPYGYPLNSKIVYVLFFNGRAPALKQVKFQIILPYVGYTGVAFPVYEYFPAPLSGLDVEFNPGSGTVKARTVQIADFDAILSQEYHKRLPVMITRIVLSTLTKELASFVAVQAAKQQGTGMEIGAYALTGVYKYLFNTADTRCWETLPKEIQAIHIPMPVDGTVIIAPGGHATETKKQATPDDKTVSFVKNLKIVLKKETRVAIIYVRALSVSEVLYKVFEIK